LDRGADIHHKDKVI